MNYWLICHFCYRASVYTTSLRGRLKTKCERLSVNRCKTFHPLFSTRWSTETYRQTCENISLEQAKAEHHHVAGEAPVGAMEKRWVRWTDHRACNSRTSRGIEARKVVALMVLLSQLWRRGRLDRLLKTLTRAMVRRCHFWRCSSQGAMKTTKTTTDFVTVSLAVKWRPQTSKFIAVV